MGYRFVDVEHGGRVARIELNRAEKLNALARPMMEEVISACRDVARSQARVAVVWGRGSSFCAGFDMSEFARLLDAHESSRTEAAELGAAMAAAVEGLPQVTIAALHGHVVGGGVVLAAACDIRIGANDAVFVIPEVDLGIPLAWGGIPRLVRELGPGRTRELIMTGRTFYATEAAGWGFINRLVDPEHLASEAGELAATIAAKPSLPIRHAKQAMGRGTYDEVAALLASFDDPECRTAMRDYLATHRSDGRAPERHGDASH